MKIEPAVLRKSAGTGDELQSGIKTGAGELRSMHRGVNTQAEGFAFTEDLTLLLESWDGRLGTDVAKECAEVAKLLRTTAASHDNNEVATRASFQSMSAAAAPGGGVGTMAAYGTDPLPASNSVPVQRTPDGGLPGPGEDVLTTMPALDPEPELGTRPTPGTTPLPETNSVPIQRTPDAHLPGPGEDVLTPMPAVDPEPEAGTRPTPGANPFG